MTVAAERPGWVNPLGPLRHRDFRNLWCGETLRTTAQWMDQITRAFLVIELTGSAASAVTHLALVNAVRSAPLLVLGLLAGVLADRVSRKRLLMASQSMNVLAALAVAALVATDAIAMWHVYLTAVVVGVGMAINAPARQAALPALVPPERLHGAVVLNTATQNVGQALGPTLGGVCIGLVGTAGSYVVEAVVFAVAGLLISRIDLPHVPRARKESTRQSLVDGLRYLRTHELLPALLLVSMLPMLLVQPFRGVLPAIASDRFAASPTATGLLVGALGAGAIISVVLVASRVEPVRMGRRIVLSSIGFAGCVVAFALTGSLVVATVALLVGGLLQASHRSQSQSLLVTETEDEYRGRMSSVWVVNRGMQPIGSLVLAGLTLVMSAGSAVAVMAAAGGLAVAVTTIGGRALWRR